MHVLQYLTGFGKRAGIDAPAPALGANILFAARAEERLERRFPALPHRGIERRGVAMAPGKH